MGRAACGGGVLTTPLGAIEALEGQIGFAWGGTRVRLDPVILHGAGIDLAGRGTLEGLGKGPTGPPALEGTFALGLDAAALARWLPSDASPSGRVDFKLGGAWRQGAPRLEGTFSSAEARLFGVDARALQGSLRWDGALHLDDVKAAFFGGTVRGGVTVRPRDSGGWQGETQVAAERLAAADLLKAAGWTGPGIDGAISYNGHHTFDQNGVPSLRGPGVATLDGSMRGPSGEARPLTARVEVEARGRTLAVIDGTLKAAATEARFSGSFSAAEGVRLRLRGASGDLTDILPLFSASPHTHALLPSGVGGVPPGKAPLAITRAALIVALSAATAAPPKRNAAGPGSGRRDAGDLAAIIKRLGGRWEWDGDLRAGAKGFDFDGKVAGRGLTWNGAPLGDLEADLTFAREHLTIRRARLVAPNGGSVEGDGTVDFHGDGHLRLDGRFERLAGALIAAIGGFKLAPEGEISGEMNVRGSIAAPEIGARIADGHLALQGVEATSLHGDVSILPCLLRSTGLEGMLGGAGVRLSGGFPYCPGPDPEGERLHLEATEVDLTTLTPLLGTVPLTGRVSIEAEIEGGILDPRGTMTIAGTDLVLGGMRLGPADLEADIQGFVARLKGGLPERNLTIAGQAEARSGVPIDVSLETAELRLRGADIDPTFPEDISFLLAGKVDVRGPLARPKSLQAEARFARVRFEAGEAFAENEAPIAARLEAGRLRLEPAVLSGPGTRIAVSGEAAIDPKEPVAVDLNGRFDLPLVRTFVQGLLAEGTGEVMLKVSGPREDPTFTGTLRIDAPHVRYPALPFPIDDVAARIAFDGFSAVIEDWKFRAGGGTVIGTGEMLLGKAGLSRGLASILAADIRLTGHGVSAEFPEGFRSVSDPDLHLVFDPTGLALEGTIDFVRAVYSRDFKIETLMLSGRAPAPFDFDVPPAVVAGMRLDLRLRAPEELWMRNDFGRIEGEADLRVTGTAAQPSITGRVTALEGSTIDFNRVRYRVLSGTIDFNDPVIINPFFDLNAETTVADYQINLRVEGTVDSFRYELTSDPPLSESDIVSVLLTGRPVGTLGAASSGLAPESVSAYLAGQLSQTLGNRFLGRVAPDLIAIDPLEVVTTQGADPATRVTLGKQLTPDLRLTYSDLLGSGASASYQVDYRVGRNVGLVSERTPEGTIAGDLRFTLPGKAPIAPWEATVAAREEVRIGAVKLEGTIGLPEKEVLDHLRLKPGRRHERARVSDRADRLVAWYRRKGYLAAEVDIDELANAAGEIELTVHVNAGPRLDLRIEGTGGKGMLEEAVVPLFSQTLFFDETVEDARARIEALVRDRGHRVAKVKASIDQTDPARTLIRFDVDEGPKTQAEVVRIEGARQIEEKRVRRVVRTHADSWLRRGVVKGGRLAEDAAAIHTLYVERGFPEADVPPADVVPLGEDGRRAEVVFRINEGPRVAVHGLRLEGVLGVGEERLHEVAGLEDGEPFIRGTIEAAVARVRRLYDDAGWPDARITWRAERFAGQAGGDGGGADDEFEERDIIVSVVEGLRQQVSDVAIGANIITDDDTIRRALKVEPYRMLSRADMLASQSRLYRLGLFRAVEVRPGPMPEIIGPPAPVASSETAPLGPETTAPGGPVTPPESAAPPVADSNVATPPEAPGTPGATEPALPAGTQEPAPAVPPESTEPYRRPVQVLVREAPPLRQTFGFGYDTEEKIRGLYEIAHRNLFGSGRYLGLQLRASSLEQRGAITYREQGVFGGRYDLLGSAYGLDEERPAFSGRTVGLLGQLSRDVTKATRLQWRYNLKDVNLSEATTEFEGTTIRL
ncbi:MAG TPA: translocation/assembly module TamB domain-containing protein, partial [Candidatus Polarisedimenticolia bacterium]|nr:translocation/assembly module TamB domain-containing protein [Candidatus Polarisedimenticolia bacterium]